MARILALAALLPALAAAVPCVQFDANFNLYAFGGEKDVSLGTSATWAAPAPKDLAVEGRPPYTGPNMQCLFAEFANAVYLVGADAADSSAIYIYDCAGDKWSKQATTGAPSVIGSTRSSAVLDHDTNNLFTIPGPDQLMVGLDMNTVKNTASASPLAWETIKTPSFKTTGYNVTAAQAANHINFFGVPGTPAGQANTFVVHYSFFQAEPQAYPAASGSSFPAEAGQAVSFAFAGKNTSTPVQMAFVPNDFSNTYVVTHWTNLGDPKITSDSPVATSLINSTQSLPAPTSQDTQAAYAADTQSLVQIDTQGNIYYIPTAINPDYTVASGAAWTKMNYQLTPFAPKPDATQTAGAVGQSDAVAASPDASKTGDKGQVTASVSPSGAATGAAAPTLARSDLLGLAITILAVATASIF